MRGRMSWRRFVEFFRHTPNCWSVRFDAPDSRMGGGCDCGGVEGPLSAPTLPSLWGVSWSGRWSLPLPCRVLEDESGRVAAYEALPLGERDERAEREAVGWRPA